MGFGSGLPSLFSSLLYHLQPHTPLPGHKGPSSLSSPSARAHFSPCHWLLFGVVSKTVEGNVLDLVAMVFLV